MNEKFYDVAFDKELFDGMQETAFQDERHEASPFLMGFFGESFEKRQGASLVQEESVGINFEKFGNLNGQTFEDRFNDYLNDFEISDKVRESQPLVQVASQFEGSHGECSWRIDDGTLKVYPTDGKEGTLANQYEIDFTSPWERFANEIERVEVDKGVKANIDATHLFANLNKCKEMDLKNLDMSKTEEMRGMFSDCRKLTSLYLSNFDTNNVTNMGYMFHNCVSLKELKGNKTLESKGLKLISTNVDVVNHGFNNETVRYKSPQKFAKEVRNVEPQKAEETLPVKEKVNSKKPTSIEQRPYGRYGSCYWSINQNGVLVIKPVDGKSGLLPDQSKIGINHLPPWSYQADKIKAVYIKEGVVANKESFNLFYGLNQCERMNLNNLDTRNMEIASSMFSGCSSLKELNLSNWDVSNLKNTSLMFDNCRSLETLNLNGFEAANNPRIVNMFRGCENLKNKEGLTKQCSKSILAWNNDKKEVVLDRTKKRNSFDTPDGRL